MEGICTLILDNISCPYYDSGNCKAESTNCCFFKSKERADEGNVMHREKKWFEKYYPKS